MRDRRVLRRAAIGPGMTISSKRRMRRERRTKRENKKKSKRRRKREADLSSSHSNIKSKELPKRIIRLRMNKKST